MSAGDHDRAAAEHQRESDRHAEQFEPSASSRSSSGSSLLLGTDFGTDVYNPTERHLVESDRHGEIAAQHRAAAAQLRDYEGETCALFPEATRASCPLLNQLTAANDVPGGVRLRFAPDVNLDAVFAHIECHIAFARVRGREGMDGCPMYVDGAQVERRDGHIMLITDGSPTDVEALRRAARAHLP